MRTLTPGDGQDLIAAYKRAWERRDPDAAVALFREDAEYRADPFEPALLGANAIRAHWNERVAQQANVEFDAEHVWVAGNTVLASWHAAFTRRTNAERVRSRGFATFEVDDAGLVSRFRGWAVTRAVGTDSTFDPQSGTEDNHGR